MKQKLALFDFDNTVCQGDSIKRLLKYYLQKHPLSVFHFLKVGILYLGYLLKFNTFEQAKSALLFPLDNMSDQEKESFYKQNIEPYYYKNIVEEMRKRQEEGCIVILCTASSEAYMKYHRLPVDVLIGTITKDDKSQIIGKNCKNEEKVNRIQRYLNENGYTIDYDHSWGYSDSSSDMPMLRLVKNKMRVELKTGTLKRWS